MRKSFGMVMKLFSFPGILLWDVQQPNGLCGILLGHFVVFSGKSLNSVPLFTQLSSNRKQQII